MYSDLGNASQIFELHSKLKEMKQGSNSVTQYFSDLQDLWQELDLFFEEDSSCAKCSIKQQLKLENERVYDFLAGLNRNLDEVRGRVVARDPFPSTDEAFAKVRREEGRRKVMLTDDQPFSSYAPKGSALVSRNSSSHGQPNHDPRMNKRGERPWCNHCNHPGHTREKCWQLHGKPANWQPRKPAEGRAYQAHSDRNTAGQTGTPIQFNKEQVEHLCCLLNQPSFNVNSSSGSTICSCSMAQSGPIIGEDNW
ncbi:hypothetical protein LWI28_028499 [Acer negundo]|uniref:Retrotransposon gag domain-containing protein n=1 Tax=Acer negundo TaxID=4023 RepID=A0AAD5NFL6_ACENE|nr:hypothetical protein LWI28_028499 [Acer negundo]